MPYLPPIPPRETKQWRGIFPGKHSGNLWQTQNIDLERVPGRLVLSDKMRRFSTTGIAYKWLLSDADLTTRWWALSASALMVSTNINPTSSYANDALASSPTDPKDMIIHEAINGEDRLVVTRDTDIAILNRTGVANAWTASWWQTTLGQSALVSGWHPIGRLKRLLAIGDTVNAAGARQAVVHTIDSADTVTASRLLFPAGWSLRLIITTSDRFWFGFIFDRFTDASNVKGTAMIIEWDGFSLDWNRHYFLQGVSPLTGFVVDDIPYFITELGIIFKYSGGSFKKVQEFPIREDGYRFDPRSRVAGQENGIDYYGAFADEERVYINVGAPMRTAVGGTDLTGGSRRMRSGIWMFNAKTLNLYHHMALGEHATAGTDINYADSPYSIPGGVMKDTDSDLRPIIVASASVHTGGATWRTSTQAGIYQQIFTDNQASNAGRNRGYFIIPYLTYAEAEAMFEGLWIKFKRFVNSNNRIIIRWRVVDPLRDADGNDESPLQAQGTWVTTTTFTCVVPTGVTTGHLVEILTGDNGGCCFNISALSATPDGAATVTVTIDEAAPTSSTDTFLARFDNFTSETAISSTTVGNQKVPFTAQAHGEFIQIMVELRGFSVEIDELLPLLQTKTLIEQH